MEMLKNLFGKQAEAAVAEPPKKNYPEVVHEIHREFMTGGDKLLAQAMEALIVVDAKEKKASILEKIGFTSTEEYLKRGDVETLKRLEKRRAEIVLYYKKHYPKHKFITEEVVDDICKKYNLVYGSTEFYKGFVPYENAKDMSAFFRVVRKKDIPVVKQRSGFFSLPVHRSLADCLFIAAPEKDFDKNKADIRGFRAVKKTPPDPIVLFTVNHGFLVVTAWGDEASDPMIAFKK